MGTKIRKVGKIRTILRAFFMKSDIDPKELKRRRKICSKCPLNSKNAGHLKWYEKIRHFVFKDKPFCTACGCQIQQKTASVTEECGMGYLGQTPKWNRLKLELEIMSDNMSTTKLTLVNVTPAETNIDLVGSTPTVNLGNVPRNTVRAFEFGLECEDENFSPIRVKVGCGVCTKASVMNASDGFSRIVGSVDVGVEPKFNKGIILEYDTSFGLKVQEIRIVAQVV